MERVQVQFTEEQINALRQQAAASRQPVSAIVRRAVDAWMAGQQRSAQVNRAIAEIGGFHSGLGDLAEHHDRYLDEVGP